MSPAAFGLRSFDGSIERHHDIDGIDVLTLRVKGSATWKAGQHFFLTFPSLNFFESHPFTPSSIPAPSGNTHEQLYIIRALKGQTKRLAKLCEEPDTTYPLPTIVCGAYGTPIIDLNVANYQFIAGGTGVSFTLPLAQQIVSSAGIEKRTLDFVWIVRRAENLKWIQKELLELKRQAAEAPGVELFIRIFVTREGGEKGSSSSSASGSVDNVVPMAEKEISVMQKITPRSDDHDITSWLKNHHPSCRDIVRSFKGECVGKTQVLASGPPELGRDLRESVALCNDGSKVWKGDGSGEVSLYWDSREN